jgi:hypothetical protein
MSDIEQLIDERRALAARLAGKDIEIAVELGDMDAARRHMYEMYAQTTARQAAKASGCFFVEQGEADRACNG